MNYNKITTLGELKKTDYTPQNIQAELANNLRLRLRNGETTFAGLIGYENTVIPDVERAILSGHNINLLGLRGQAKTRLARQMTQLLDEWVPVVAGSEINDDPFCPISRYTKELIAAKGKFTTVGFIYYGMFIRFHRLWSRVLDRYDRFGRFCRCRSSSWISQRFCYLNSCEREGASLEQSVP